MKQDFFNFDDPAEPEPEPAAPPPRPRYDWNWWDPWPEGLTEREYLILQIRRDMRALEEETDPEYEDFFALRILAYREQVKKMDADRSDSQQALPADVPGADR